VSGAEGGGVESHFGGGAESRRGGGVELRGAGGTELVRGGGGAELVRGGGGTELGRGGGGTELGRRLAVTPLRRNFCRKARRSGGRFGWGRRRIALGSAIENAIHFVAQLATDTGSTTRPAGERCRLEHLRRRRRGSTPEARFDARAIRERHGFDLQRISMRFTREAFGREHGTRREMTEQARRARATERAHRQREPAARVLQIEREGSVDERMLEGTLQARHRAEQVADPHRRGRLHELAREHLTGDALEALAVAFSERLIEREERFLTLVERDGVESRARLQSIEREMGAHPDGDARGERGDGGSAELSLRGFQEIPEEPGAESRVATHRPVPESGR
jgi:hypothetical protein